MAEAHAQPDSEDFPGKSPATGDSLPQARRTTEIRIARNFFIFAVLTTIAGAPHFLTQHRTFNYLIYLAAIAAIAGITVTRGVEQGPSESFRARFRAALSGEQWITLGVFVAFLAVYAVTMFDPSPFNEQARQAFAFIHGHTYIDAPNSFLEHAQVGPYSYALHPPLAPILMIPVAAIWGMAANQTEFSVVLGAVGIVLAWILLGEFELSTNARIWLTIFFGTGTIYWYESVMGTTWAMPIVVVAVFLLALVIELFGAARPLWLGIWGGLACLARYDAALAMPVLSLLAWRRGRSLSELLWIAPGFLVAGVIFVGFNEARYGTWFDVGLDYIPGVKHGDWTALKYLPGNLNTLLFMAPKVDGTFPYFHPTFIGQALTLTSPAFVLALRPSFKRLEVSAMGLAAILISIPSLLHSTNGFAQFGCRFYIQAFPFLLVMMAMGMPRKTDQLTKILIVTSVALVGFGVWHVHVWGLAGP